MPLDAEMEIVDRHGEEQEYDERKVYASVYHPAREAGYSEEEAEALAEDVTDDVTTWVERHHREHVSSRELRAKIIQLLEAEDEDVAYNYRYDVEL